jgi:hypothetical protein
VEGPLRSGYDRFGGRRLSAFERRNEAAAFADLAARFGMPARRAYESQTLGIAYAIEQPSRLLEAERVGTTAASGEASGDR